MTRGKFITLEGLDGAGKTTQLASLTNSLKARGIPLRVTREPGGTEMGEALRALLLDRGQAMHAETEALLMFAARREHLDKVVLPTLAEGTWVLCDRFTDATFAYQGGGSGVDWKKLESLERWLPETARPDLTLYLDIEPQTAHERIGGVKPLDRYEREATSFHERVRAAYLRRALESGGRICVIDASRTVAEVQLAMESAVTALCTNATARPVRSQA